MQEGLQIAFDFLREPGVRLAHAEDDAGDTQAGIDAFADEGGRFQQFAQTVQGEKVRLQWDENFTGGAQRVQRQNAKRQGAIHQNEVKGLLIGLQQNRAG